MNIKRPILVWLILAACVWCVNAQPSRTVRINLNTATAAELEALPGIGKVLAQRIVEHRRLHGPFRRPADVIIVRGMSAARYRRIAHLIRT